MKNIQSLKHQKMALINGAMFTYICRMDSTKVFQLALSDVTAKAPSMISNTSIDLSSVLKEYHNFLDIFNKEQASMLNFLLFEKWAHICSPRDDRSGAKGPGLSGGAYMLIILSIPIVIMFVSLLVLS